MARERVQKVLARAGIASRRRAEELIRLGRVTVNGATIETGVSADPAVDRIEVDGRPVPSAPAGRYVALHKPPGYVSSARGERGRPSVLELLPPSETRLWPAGRLDVESEGLMVLTNDGDWANRLLHPRYGMRREYAVLVAGAPDRGTLEHVVAGVELHDGPAHLLAARRSGPPPEVERAEGEVGTWLRVQLAEGRKREVRRILGAVGLEVIRLVRVGLGPLSITGLRPGQWRALGADEVGALVDGSPVDAVASARSG